jgi:hypothetical protein
MIKIRMLKCGGQIASKGLVGTPEEKRPLEDIHRGSTLLLRCIGKKLLFLALH